MARRTTAPQPAWRWLYAVIPLAVILFTVADAEAPTPGWRTLTETIGGLAVIAAMAAWVRANRLALTLAGRTRDEEGVTAQVIRSSPRSRRGSVPTPRVRVISIDRGRRERST